MKSTFIKSVISILLVIIISFSFESKYAKATADSDEKCFGDIIDQFVQKPEPIESIKDTTFLYDDEGNRLIKRNALSDTKYFYKNGMLYQEIGTNNIIYLYDEMNRCIRELVNGKPYNLIYDENGNVIKILDDNEEIVAEYEYNSLLPTVYKIENEIKIPCSDSGFIGNINHIRWKGWYFDCETNCYYLRDGIYYDPSNETYIQNEYTLNRGALENEPTIVQLIATAYTMYLATPTFGATTYSALTQSQWNSGQRWYNGIGQVELLTRCIYAENDGYGNDGKNNRTAEAVVILNRIATGMDTTPYSAITRQSQFSTINPGNYTASVQDTYYARQALDKTDTRVQNALLIACSIYYSQDKTVLGYMSSIPSYINNQIFFLSFKKVYQEAWFTVSGGNLYYGTHLLSSVALPGVTQITASNYTTVGATYYNQGHNVFFIY